ncbi:MAG: ABC transporter ATP-binding protein [Candidatus Coatesbacteria bacterium]|nr:ABC transporter ATP-binding protein [Candidatus Coatesbacteria bacterium]
MIMNEIEKKANELMKNDTLFREAIIKIGDSKTRAKGQSDLNAWIDQTRNVKDAVEISDWLFPDNYRILIDNYMNKTENRECIQSTSEIDEKPLSICMEARNLGMTFGIGTKKEFRALYDVSFAITDVPDIGELISIVGPSGCGKSTLLNIIAGFDGYVPPTEGELTIQGKSIKGPGKERGMIFQKYSSFPHLNVEQNLLFGFEVNEDFRNISKMEKNELVKEWLNKVGLFEHRFKYPSQLSGGQQQRVAIARTLILKPRFILMDEPFSALDEPTRLEMQELLVNLYFEIQPTILLVTHSITEAVYLSDRVWLMGGKPGTIKSVFNDIIPPVKGIKPIVVQEEAKFKDSVKKVMEEFRKIE